MCERRECACRSVRRRWWWWRREQIRAIAMQMKKEKKRREEKEKNTGEEERRTLTAKAPQGASCAHIERTPPVLTCSKSVTHSHCEAPGRRMKGGEREGKRKEGDV